jgi:Phage integrase family
VRETQERGNWTLFEPIRRRPSVLCPIAPCGEYQVFESSAKGLARLALTTSSSPACVATRCAPRHSSERLSIKYASARASPGFTPHELRHSAASLAIAAGTDVKIIQRMLGHKSAVMTLDRYGHLFGDRLDLVDDAMDAARTSALAERHRFATAVSDAEVTQFPK